MLVAEVLSDFYRILNSRLHLAHYSTSGTKTIRYRVMLSLIQGQAASPVYVAGIVACPEFSSME